MDHVEFTRAGITQILLSKKRHDYDDHHKTRKEIKIPISRIKMGKTVTWTPSSSSSSQKKESSGVLYSVVIRKRHRYSPLKSEKIVGLFKSKSKANSYADHHFDNGLIDAATQKVKVRELVSDLNQKKKSDPLRGYLYTSSEERKAVEELREPERDEHEFSSSEEDFERRTRQREILKTQQRLGTILH